MAFTQGTVTSRAFAFNDGDFGELSHVGGTPDFVVGIMVPGSGQFNGNTAWTYGAEAPDVTVQAGGNADHNVYLAVWLDPPTGTQDMVATFEGATDLVMIAASYTADGAVSLKAGPVTATNDGTSDSPDITISADAGDLTLAALGIRADSGPTGQGSGQNLIATQIGVGSSDHTGSGSDKPGSSSGLSWTLSASADWRTAGVVLEEAAGGGETVMDADPASFTITGSASDSVRALLIDADPATYQITGASADTLRALLMDADAASMAVTGASADTVRALILTADPASFEVTGAAADTLRALLMQADPGTMTITGAAADTVTGAEIFMDADPASFAITGASSDLLRNLVMVADPAGYAITGAPADLLRALVMAADAASLTITGAASDTVRGIIMDADAAVFEVTGAAADSLRALLMDADAGALVISGASADTIATGVQVPLQPPYTAVWIDPERGAVWIAVNRDASFIDPDRKAHWS